MLRSRIVNLRRVVSSIPQLTNTSRCIPIRTYKVNQECDAHMNELPIPCGPWKPWYDAKQSFYNKVFLGGILWFVFSFAMMMMTDSIRLNFSPPPNPAPSTPEEGDCDDED